MAYTTQYIGSRYVPLFAEPAEWDSTRTYEPLTIVIHEGNSYTSRQYVPAGIDITNEKFWALTGNYNAQVEQYRRDVATLGEHVKTNTNNIATNTNNIATNTKNIATNTNDIATNTNNIATNTKNIATNTNDIATNTNDIATNKNNVADIAKQLKSRIVCYQSFASMVSDDSLTSGLFVKTTCYSDMNDCGGAYYYTVDNGTSKPDNGLVVQCKNCLAIIVPTNELSITALTGMCMQKKANNYTYNDWAYPIQAAIDQFSGISEIVVPKGTFYIGNTLVCRNNTTLKGTSQETSILKLIPYSNCDMLDVGVIGSRTSTLIDSLNLQGDLEFEYNHGPFTYSTQGRGIVLRENSYDADGVCIRNCYIKNFSEDGIFIPKKVFVTSIENCTILLNRYNGIYNRGTDNFFTNLRLYHNGLSGIKNFECGANKFTNIKAYYNCSITGLGDNELDASNKIFNAGIIEHNTSRQEYVNIECQDNYYTGFSLNACSGLHLNCTLDDNGFQKTADTSSGISELYLYASQNNYINASISENDLGFVEHLIDIFTCSNNTIQFERATYKVTPDDTHVSGNKVNINGSGSNNNVFQSFNVIALKKVTLKAKLSFNNSNNAQTTLTLPSNIEPTIITPKLYTSDPINVYCNWSGSTLYVNAESINTYTLDITAYIDIYTREF